MSSKKKSSKDYKNSPSFSRNGTLVLIPSKTSEMESYAQMLRGSVHLASIMRHMSKRKNSSKRDYLTSTYLANPMSRSSDTHLRTFSARSTGLSPTETTLPALREETKAEMATQASNQTSSLTSGTLQSRATEKLCCKLKRRRRCRRYLRWR